MIPTWNPKPITKSDGDGYNPYRDADGRFASGPGQGGKGGGDMGGKGNPPAKKKPAPPKPKKTPAKLLTPYDARMHIETSAKQYPEWRGFEANKELYGNVNFEGFNKRQVHKITSYVSGELELRCKKLGIPSIRGIHPVGTGKSNPSAGGACGDGILYVSSSNFRPRPAYERKERGERLKRNLAGAIESYTSGAYEGHVSEEDAKRYIEIFQRELDASGSRKTGENDIWKPGDPLNLRPYTADEYCIDRQKSIIDHEFAHHIHQQWKQNEKIYKLPLTPMEIRINGVARDHAFRFDTINGRWAPKDGAEHMFPSKYSEVNPKEWFAECYSLWVNDRKDLVPECLHDLMKEVSP